MYTVEVRGKFESAHRLREYKGKCENLHGHNWKVSVRCQSPKLDDIGIVMDFRILKDHLKEVTEQLDHVYLNELEAFTGVNPTSENIAKYIFDVMAEKLACEKPVTVSSVSVWETEGSCATYHCE